MNKEQLFEEVKDFMSKQVTEEFLLNQTSEMTEEELKELCLDRCYDFTDDYISHEEVLEVSEKLYEYLYN